MSFVKFFKQLKYNPTEFTKIYKDCLTKTHALETRRQIRLRASSLPTCSLLTLEKMLLNETETEEAMMDYYCSVGTTVHSHLQKWIGKSGKIYGDWLCKNCNYTHKNTLVHICPNCTHHMEYVELEIEYNIFSGHIDGLIQQKNGKFIVYDFKTSSTKHIYAKKYIPVAKHLIQVCAYAAVLRKVHQMDIESVSIMYIARDNPTLIAEFNLKFTDDILDFTLDFLKNQIKGFKSAVKSVESGDIKHAIKYKMCSSINEYKEEVEKFFTYDPCPLCKICFDKNALLEHFNDIK